MREFYSLSVPKAQLNYRKVLKLSRNVNALVKGMLGAFWPLNLVLCVMQ